MGTGPENREPWTSELKKSTWFRNNFIVNSEPVLNFWAMEEQRSTRLSPPLRGQIIVMVEGGKTVAQVAGQLNLSLNTVYYWVRRFRESDESLKDGRRSGRPRATNDLEDNRIRHLIEDKPLSIGGAAAISREAEFGCSYATTRRRVIANGIQHHKPALKPFLTEQQKHSRLLFGRNNLVNDQVFWDLTIFADEKTFRSNQEG
ncbi:histone-lysine N-methyltransferase SETMAR-like [Ischnura elegans]|uniref:histone-lysine N-methyltransferase SETMAR-like n=1 Tax=Ischnura elegans TaxID=197161 RepID=UPI001ED8B45A|nr:histone-lysine N-methyltransferase SETMAR-like [Ischnura elegans]